MKIINPYTEIPESLESLDGASGVRVGGVKAAGLIIDCFAGGGGASKGIEMALNRPVDIAVNHDPEAIRIHKVNHPNTLHRHLGFGVKRLHDFYLAMAAEHRRMREFYEMDDLYSERIKLKELGADIEQWQKEVLSNEPEALGKR